MKTLVFLCTVLLISHVHAQEIREKEIKSEVSEVTVFLEGAQVTRDKTIEMARGKTLVKFVDLSPFIDAKSIQVRAVGELTVLSVNHQQNYLEKSVKSDALTELEARLESVDKKIKLQNTHLAIIREELAFLDANRDIGGKSDQVSVSSLQQAAEFYSKKLTSLKMDEIERSGALEELNRQRSDLLNQMNTLAAKREFPSGEILVKIDARSSGSYKIGLSYMVGNAGWFPSYDIRARNINEPVNLIYKANVKQDTKVDWNNVKLRFSSADPNVSGIAPELQTYYLNYNTLPPTYKLTSNTVRGRVTGSRGEPLPGVSVMVEGSTIGTVTDMEGNYSITIPNSSSRLSFSYVGYNTQHMPASAELMNIRMQEDVSTLNEMVLYSTFEAESDVSQSLQGRASGMDKSSVRIRGTSSLPVPMAQVENQTTVDFEIRMPYTIKSDNKNYTVDMEAYNLPAFYQYYSVPKIDKDAFLIANIVDWEKYNLLEAEASVFFEDTYVGKTLMDVRYASDTLEISLGRDKMVSINREKIRDYTDRKFLANKKEETRGWKTTVKNNKGQEINMIILDQVPVSTLEEIEVNVQETSGGKHNRESGEIRWELTLQPSGNKELELKYSVKYPKNKNLILE